MAGDDWFDAPLQKNTFINFMQIYQMTNSNKNLNDCIEVAIEKQIGLVWCFRLTSHLDVYNELPLTVQDLLRRIHQGSMPCILLPRSVDKIHILASTQYISM